MPVGRRTLIIAALVAALAGYVALRGRGGTDADRIRGVISDVEEACEAKDVGGVATHISERYRDAEGLRKNEIKGLLFAQFLGQREKISVRRLGSTEVEMRGRSAATARFRAAIAGGGSALLSGERWDFEVELEKEDGVWRVTSHWRKPAP